MMTREQDLQAATWHAEKASELAEFLALPGDYFSPRGGQHWYQVVSRSEIEERLATETRMIAFYEKRAAA